MDSFDHGEHSRSDSKLERHDKQERGHFNHVYVLSALSFRVVCGTPATIFMLIVGAISSVWGLPMYMSFVINIVPIILFVLLCFTTSNNVQLTYAGFLCILYTLVMMIVLVGLIKQVAISGFCSVSTIFLVTLTSIFVFSAFLHPQEIGCLFHGFLYFLAIPSMSILLMIFSLSNLQNVSWGTREVKTAAPPVSQQAQQAKKPAHRNILEQFVASSGQREQTSSDFAFSFGNVFRCFCCPRSEVKDEDLKFKAILQRLDELDFKLSGYTSGVDSMRSNSDLPVDAEANDPKENQPFSENAHLFEGAGERDNPRYRVKKQAPRDELRNPYWINDKDLGKGSIRMNDPDENVFWSDLIQAYLFPIEGDKEKEKRTKKDLIELRNNVCLAFFIINALFIILLFALETIAEQTKSLSFEMPCDTEGITPENVQPIALSFTLVFGILIVLQFLAMLFHRFSTFLHIAAITALKLRRKPITGNKEQTLTMDETIELVQQMQAIRDDDDDMSVAPDYDDDMSVAPNYDEDIAPDYSDDDTECAPKYPRKHQFWPKFQGRMKGLQIHRTLNKSFMKNFNRLATEIKDENVEEKKKEDIQTKFRGFEKKSIHTIIKLAQADKGYKQDVLKTADKWHEAVNRLNLSGELKSNKLESFADVVKEAMRKEKSGKEGTKTSFTTQALVNEEVPKREGTQQRQRQRPPDTGFSWNEPPAEQNETRSGNSSSLANVDTFY